MTGRQANQSRLYARRAVLRAGFGASVLALAGCGTDRPGGAEHGAVNPRAEPFRAAGDGIADDTGALQAAMGAVARHDGSGALRIPPGRYRVSDTIRIRNARGLRVSGSSTGGVILSWEGPDDRPLLLLDDTRDSVFSDFTVVVPPPYRLHAAIRSENGPDARIPPTHNLFQNLVLEGGDHRGLDFGFRIAAGQGGDANNEFHDFFRCAVSNYRVGYSIEHSQSHTNRFYSCAFSGNGRGEAGVRTDSGSFYWYGGGGGGNTQADFVLGSPNVTVSIINGNFEGSSRLLTTGGPTGARWPITVQGVRFSADRLHRDGIMIDMQTPGPLTLMGNLFGESVEWPTPRVRMHANVPGLSLVSRGNLWIGRNALDASPYVFEGGGARSVNAAIEGESFIDGSLRDPTVFSDGATAPAVHTGRWFRTANRRRTVISDFSNGWPGQEITVLVGDDNTMIDFTAGRLVGNGAVHWYPSAGDSMRCTFDGARWICQTTRSG